MGRRSRIGEPELIGIAVPYLPHEGQFERKGPGAIRGKHLAILARCRENQQTRGRLQNMDSGKLVLVTLYNPREKFWGLMLALEPAGVSIRGVDLQSLEDFTQLVKSGEPASASMVFFPMHRVQRIEEDGRTGELPSLAEQFHANTGVDVNKFFAEPKK